ncbi:MAG: helix-turn-helix transcriptional regulator [Clostridia bacterium]|nr:helix-turn-helix transcriptional regulator [Clostridia bacterium]
MAASILGERLRWERERAELTQIQAAERLGTKNYVIANYESGRTEPQADFIRRAADLYGCSTDYLLGKTNCRNEHISDGIGPGIATRITRITGLAPDAEEDVLQALKWAEYEVRRKIALNKRTDKPGPTPQ